jgi:hypothetical protein
MGESAQFVLMILMAGFGAFVGAYLREKGKHLATREDLEPIIRGQETIKQQLAHSTFVEGRRWELKREITWELLSQLAKAQISLREQSTYYMEPGSEHSDNSEDPRFAYLSKTVSAALQAVQELAGPAQLFLSREAIDALQKLALEEWHAGYSAGPDRLEYIDNTLPLIEQAQATVLAVAKAELAPPFKEASG